MSYKTNYHFEKKNQLDLSHFSYPLNFSFTPLYGSVPHIHKYTVLQHQNDKHCVNNISEANVHVE